MVSASHIVKNIDGVTSELEARREIEAALEELESGKPFKDVVDKYSDCKSNGGDLGRFQRGVMVDEFDNVVFALKPGERSEIFRSPFGFHIAEVRAVEEEGFADFADVKDDITRVLTGMLQQAAYRRALDALRQRSTIRHISQEEADAMRCEKGRLQLNVSGLQ